jgi:hypothetical protein
MGGITQYQTPTLEPDYCTTTSQAGYQRSIVVARAHHHRRCPQCQTTAPRTDLSSDHIFDGVMIFAWNSLLPPTRLACEDSSVGSETSVSYNQLLLLRQVIALPTGRTCRSNRVPSRVDKWVDSGTLRSCVGQTHVDTVQLWSAYRSARNH